jgi:hypothetical protein
LVGLVVPIPTFPNVLKILVFDLFHTFKYEFDISSFPNICNSAKFKIYAKGSFPTKLFIVHPIYKYGMSKIIGNIFS